MRLEGKELLVCAAGNRASFGVLWWESTGALLSSNAAGRLSKVTASFRVWVTSSTCSALAARSSFVSTPTVNH